MTFKKFVGISVGFICGIALFAGVAAAQQTTVPTNPGNPNVYNPTGSSRVSGQNPTGRFTSIQGVGLAVIDFIQFIIIPFIMTLGLLTFLWGVLQFIRNGGDPGKREEGRQFMLWGIVGLAVMASVWGLVRILTNTIGSPFAVPTLNTIR